MKKRIIIILAIILTGFFIIYKWNTLKVWFLNLRHEPVPAAISVTNFNFNTNPNQPTTNQNLSTNKLNQNSQIQPSPILPENQDEPEEIPTSFNLAVPFTTQAPYFDWDMPYQEGCEEASLLTVHYYYQEKTFTEAVTKQEILDLVAWQEKNWGGHFDLTTEETAQLAKDYWGYEDSEVIYNPTIDEIKSFILNGYPVIVPAAGRLLDNPYFTPPGPIYHMLVIKGWTENNFITNDPGLYTKGEDFQYSYENLMDSIHDWNDGDVYTGRKVMLILK